MRNFFKSNKNAGALALLLCCFFFNLGVGVAQMGTFQTTIGGQPVTITPETNCSGVCSTISAYLGTTFPPNGGQVDIDPLVNPAFSTIPASKYLRVKSGTTFSLIVTMKGIGFPNPSGQGQWNRGPFYVGYGAPSSVINAGSIPPANFCTIESLGNNGGVETLRISGKIPKGTTNAWIINPIIGFIAGFGTPVNANSLVLPIVSEGILDSEVPIIGTTVQPQIPYMILHAPPGDASSSAFQETKTTCREFTETYSEDGSNSVNAAVKLGIAGSVGFIVTTDFEFSVTLSAGVTVGGVQIKTNSNQTCVTTSQGFETGSLDGLDGSGDVFIGYGTDLNYGIYRSVRVDPNTCQAVLDTGLIYTPTGEPRDFAYSETQIQQEILSQKAIADNPANSVRARNIAQNQADVWEKVLAQNNANKNNPNNALIQSISFSSGIISSHESSITVVETNSLDVEHYVDFNVGLSSVVEIAGSGVSGGWEYRGSYRYGNTQTQSQEVSKLVKYTLSDGSTGDVFNMKVVRDPMYGTPVFRLEPTSRTSCPYQGGYQRDQPKLKHDGTTSDHITLLGNPVGSSATFKLDLCNESNEARTYHLKLNAASNLNGAVVSAAGVPLNGNDDGQVFPVPANGCIQDLIVEVKQQSANSPLAYPDLELFLFAPCEEDIQTSVFASVFFGNATGVNDLADNSLLSISPNPTSGWLQISLPASNTLESVRVMDLSGKTVRNLELGAAASTTELDLSGLPKGIYALQARSEGQVFVKKVIVE